MRLQAKPIPLLVFLLVASPLILLLGLNFYLQTNGVRQQLKQSLSDSLGVPVTIQGVSATPWGGVRISKLAVDSHGNSSTGNILFRAESAVIYPDLFRLFQGDLSIREIIIKHPAIQLTQSQRASPIPAPPSLDIRSSGSLPSPDIKASTPANPPLPREMESVKRILGTLPSLRVTDASFTLLNPNNLPVAVLQGITLRAKGNPGEGWKGSVNMDQAAIGTSLVLHDLHSPVTISSDATTLTLDALDAVLGGGRLSGDFSLCLPPAAPRYHANLHLSEASLKQFLTDASLADSCAEGRIAGDLQLSGIAGSGPTMEGKSTILCTNAIIQPADFLKQIGQILQIEELQLLHLSEVKTVFVIHEGKTLIEDLTLRSDNLILTAHGPLLLTGDIDLQARLLFNEKLTSRIRGILGPQLSQAPEKGYTQVSFHVAGSLKNPKTDLLERLTGIHIGGNLGGFLQGLFGRPSSPPASSGASGGTAGPH